MKQSTISILKNLIADAVRGGFSLDISPDTVRLEHPAEESKGDYASNIAMVLAGKLKQKPMDIAGKLADTIKRGIKKEAPHPNPIRSEQETHVIDSEVAQTRGGRRPLLPGEGNTSDIVEDVAAAAPGFLNFRLKPDFLIATAEEMVETEGFVSLHPGLWEGKKIMVEFAHPNPLKEFHIGHLRNIALGESLVRLLEASGATVFRANYESDIGMHTAKALWGVKKKITDEKLTLAELRKRTPAQKAEFLGQAYALGNKAIEEDEAIKKEIIALNKTIYKDPHAADLWEETRQWSLDYFDTIYKRLGSRFDRLFFESETEKPGREMVVAAVEKGLFIKDADGSIYFPGKKFGLNNCVFVTREQYATYEGKDMALEHQEHQAFPYDLNIHVVANEQINFFQIVFAALEQLFPYQKGRQYHLAYGMVKLKSGKMSSRTGEVITADELIDMAKGKIRIINQSTNQPINQSTNEKEETVEKIAVAAVKYTMLRVNPKQDIAFDLGNSVSLEGDSGPYLLYTHARCKSVIRKALRHSEAAAEESRGSSGIQTGSFDSLRSLRMTSLNEEELSLLRHVSRFPEVVGEAAKEMSPNLIAQYLFDLAQRYNVFYNKHQILQKTETDTQPTEQRRSTTALRVSLTETTAALLQQGLFLLGIETVERM